MDHIEALITALEAFYDAESLLETFGRDTDREWRRVALEQLREAFNNAVDARVQAVLRSMNEDVLTQLPKSQMPVYVPTKSEGV